MIRLPIRTFLVVIFTGLAAVAWANDEPSSATERSGIISIHGKGLTLVGQPVKAGDAAPAFTAAANDMSTFNFDPKAGKVYILSAVPSLDTSVCSMETKRFNEEASKLEGVQIITISMDLPFAQKRWCGAEGVKNLQTVSDYRDRSFGLNYGVLIKENKLLARAVFVVGKDGRITYEQIVADLAQQPDYDAVLAAAKASAGKWDAGFDCKLQI